MKALSASEAAAFDSSSPAAGNALIGARVKSLEDAAEADAPEGDTRLDNLEADVAALIAPGIPFFAKATLTAAAAGTPVHVIPAANVPAGKKIHIIDIVLNVSDSTAWTDSTATLVKLQDTADTPIVAASYAKAGLTANAVLGKIGTNITPGVDIQTGVGLTADKGLDIVGDAIFAAGSDIKVSVFGLFI